MGANNWRSTFLREPARGDAVAREGEARHHAGATNMRSFAFAFTIAVPLLTTAALAQTPPTSTPSEQSANSGQKQANQEAVRQQVRKNLQQAGFTDIKLVPSSFLVRAKDKQGNQVMMFITPNSVTAVTKAPASDTTTGQGSSPNEGGQGSSANQGNEDSSPKASPSGK
jgi:hypothetical protein